MSIFYRVAYQLGFKPWEEAATHPAAAENVASLFDREQEGRERPYGKALDLGCGSGFWAVDLARRGWEVVGIDIVPKAVAEGRERVRQAGVEAQLVEGDVTALRSANVGTGFTLVWDFGTVHGLTQTQRAEVGREVTAVTTENATLLMLAWKPGRRGPFPRGASRVDVQAAYPDWDILDERPFDATGLPRPLRNVDPRSYRLRRRA